MVCRSHAQELFKLILSSLHRTLLLFLPRRLTSSSEMGAPNILNPGTVAGNARMGNWIMLNVAALGKSELAPERANGAIGPTKGK